MTTIELLKEEDIQEVSDLIIRTTEKTLKHFIPNKAIENIINRPSKTTSCPIALKSAHH